MDLCLQIMVPTKLHALWRLIAALIVSGGCGSQEGTETH